MGDIIITLITFSIAIFIFAITPGPGVFALIATALRSGFRSCLGLASGMALMDVIYLVAVFLGLSVVAEKWHFFYSIVRIAGAFYLCYLAILLWRADIRPNDNISRTNGEHSFWRGLLTGMIISGSNPKVMLFYIGFLPTFFDLQGLGADYLVILATICFVSLMMGLLLVSAMVVWARGWMLSGRRARLTNRLSAGIMFGAGAWLIVQSRS